MYICLQLDSFNKYLSIMLIHVCILCIYIYVMYVYQFNVKYFLIYVYFKLYFDFI